VTKDDGNNGVKLIVVNIIPPDHVDDVPVVEPNQHDDVPVVSEPVLADEEEDPKEEEFEEDEEPQEDKDDIEVGIEEDKKDPNERIEREFYWTRVQAHEFYQKMFHRGFMFEERPSEAIDVPVKMQIVHHLSRKDLLVIFSSLVSIVGLTKNIKGEVTSSNPANRNEAVRMAHKLMKQKSHARDERILEVKKRKWGNYQSRNSSDQSNHRGNSRQTLQNNQKQRNTRAMISTPTDGKVSSRILSLCEHYFTHHIGPCTIKCHKCGKVRHKARYCNEKSVATGDNVQPIMTCYDCGKRDAEPQGPNVVTGMFLLNILYASILFDLGSDRSFGDTRFSSMLNINPIQIGASYEVELADERVVSTNTVLKGCTLNLVNHIFDIDLMMIELGTFDVIVNMDAFSSMISLSSVARKLFDEEEHGKHLKIILKILKKERLYTKFSKCDFWLDSVQFLGYVIDRSSVHVDPAKIKAIKN
nr:hypothetical protein [Tanacetum cinerariifolium]